MLAAGIVALALADKTGGGLWLTALGIAARRSSSSPAASSATRRAGAPRSPEEPFATLDRRNYSPLCLFIGAGFFILVVLRLI